PRYDAVLLYRLDLPRRAPEAFAAMNRLVGKIDEKRMVRANSLVVLKKRPSAEAAAALLKDALGTSAGAAPMAQPGVAAEIAKDAARHLQLVAISLFAAIVLGVPLGVLATRSRF